MSVRRHLPWGELGELPPGSPVVYDDSALRRIVEEARRTGAEPPAVGLLGGDLCKTLGGGSGEERLRTGQAGVFRVDVGRATIDGQVRWFVSHLLARRWLWRGTVVAVMGAEWMGRWDVAPRAHPGDGRFDLLVATMGPSEKLAARRRLATATHVPHPAIEERRVEHLEVDLERGSRVWLDGEPAGRATSLEVVVEPEALTVVV